MLFVVLGLLAQCLPIWPNCPKMCNVKQQI